jgi:hypothetical protein
MRLFIKAGGPRMRTAVEAETPLAPAGNAAGEGFPPTLLRQALAALRMTRQEIAGLV